MGGASPRQPRGASTKVGDTIELKGPSSYVRLPDGAAVTARTTYTFLHKGKHVFINAATSDEKTVNVAPAEK